MNSITNDPPSGEPAGPPPVRKWRRRFKRVGIVAGALLAAFAAMLGGAEYYTSRPAFCGSCHIMDPYYEGWQKDAHAVTTYAPCVECHYAPGEQHTIRAKFRGLSQAASYFSGRYGAGRPRAHVQDASCLQSGCHGDAKYMTAENKLGTVVFSHAKHLDPASPNIVAIGKNLADLRAGLTSRLGAEGLAAVEQIANAVQPADRRNEQLAAWLAAHARAALYDDVTAYAELLHTEARIAQLGNLHCASCHQFDPATKGHFAVAKTTCYTCHFLNQPFNANTARCLSCHKPPAGPVPVHYGAKTATDGVPTTAITMDHAMILANNVNCVSCHADLVHGTGQVTPRDCQNCHDQARFYEDFPRRTIDVVRTYHLKHSAGQHARCNDCHQMIDHRLAPIASPSDAEALLGPVRRACQHCHPDHHHEQVAMLVGEGGFTGEAQGMPNEMTGSRANCQACHTQAGADPKGEAVIRSAVAACRGCHGRDYEDLFVQWQTQIHARLTEAQNRLAQVKGELAATTKAAGREQPEASRLLARAEENIRLVATANGIHNRNYAMLLLDQAMLDLEAARRPMPPATAPAGSP